MAAELIIQLQKSEGSFTCEKYVNFPSIKSAFITICFVDNAASETTAIELKSQLIASIEEIEPSFHRENPPCGVSDVAFGSCHALAIADNLKWMVVVSNGVSTSFREPAVLNWQHDILPVLQNNKPVNLPLQFKHLHAEFWSHKVDEVIPYVFGLIGVSSPDQKIFISYRRSNTEEMAIQLFNALGQARFDVFLDRFSITPGVNFQQRLYQELSDKAMVLFLESPHFMESPWVQLEVDFAKRYRLGLLALNLEASPPVKSLDKEFRIEILAADLMPDKLTLTADKLDYVVNAIRQHHAIALYRMKHYLDTNVIAALNDRGMASTSDQHGFICVSGAHGNDHKIWTTPRPAALNDYHYTDTLKQSHERGIVIGPGFIDEKRTLVNNWLSVKTNVRFYTEGELLKMVDDL